MRKHETGGLAVYEEGDDWITIDNDYAFRGGVDGKMRYVQVRACGYTEQYRYDLWGWLHRWLTPQRALAKAFKFLADRRDARARGLSRASLAVKEVEAQVEVEKLLA